MATIKAGNTTYDYEVLQVEFEDQYNTKLSLSPFYTVDNTLVGVVGEKIKIHTYVATEGTEVLAEGEGNTKTITVSYGEKEYTIELLQNRFAWNDEQAMRDNNIVPKGQNQTVVDMVNTSNVKCIAEFNKATLVVPYAKANGITFDTFVDALAKFPENEQGDMAAFCLMHPLDAAAVRKSLKDTLQYVEAYVRTGYIGHVAGVPIYTSNLITKGAPVIATKTAVTYFSKKGTEIEYVRDADHRYNEMYTRKYGMFALTDARRVVRIVCEDDDNAYEAVESPIKADLPYYYEKAEGKYALTNDTEINSGTTYYVLAA